MNSFLSSELGSDSAPLKSLDSNLKINVNITDKLLLEEDNQNFQSQHDIKPVPFPEVKQNFREILKDGSSDKLVIL